MPSNPSWQTNNASWNSATRKTHIKNVVMILSVFFIIAGVIIAGLVYPKCNETQVHGFFRCNCPEGSALQKSTGLCICLNNGTQLGFHIERPHCIPSYPYLMTEVPEAMNQGAIVYAKMVVDKKKPKKAKLNLEFVVDSPKGERIGWFALRDFPSFFSASIVDVKFQPTAGIKNQTYVLEGLKDSTYQAQQICNSGHMLRSENKQVKI